MRHGKGVFTDRDGTEYFGQFVDDDKDGEIIVKVIVPIEEIGQPNYEIRIGKYEKGKFERWKSKFSNENSTKAFIRLFYENKDMFDSMYGMILARNLPNLPEGIDAKNKQVQEIMVKIRSEAGSLVGQDALVQAHQQIDSILGPIRLKEKELVRLHETVDASALKLIAMKHESADIYRKYTDMMADAEKLEKVMEQAWMDDPLQTRYKFQDTIKKLKEIPAVEFFKFKNFRNPPLFTKKIMDAISYLLRLPTDWLNQKLLMSDSVYNSTANEGDKTAVRFQYDCKFVHMMNDYNVVDYLDEEADNQRHLLELILADPRFRMDSYYIESLGVGAPVLVDWIKANNAYIQKARSMIPSIRRLEKMKFNAYRIKANHEKKKSEVEEMIRQQEMLKKQIFKESLDVHELQEALSRANYMLKFVEDSFVYSQDISREDYYRLLEEKLERGQDIFQVQTSIQMIIDGVEKKLEDAKLAVIRDALAHGRKYVEPEVEHHDIQTWIIEEIRALQAILIGT